MKCLGLEIIQQYLDGECNPDEQLQMQLHIEECEECALKVGTHKQLIMSFNKELEDLSGDDIDIPEFKTPVRRAFIRPLFVKTLIPLLAAAGILLLILILPFEQPQNGQQAELIFNQLPTDEYFDANRTIGEQKMIMRVVAPDGTISEIELN